MQQSLFLSMSMVGTKATSVARRDVWNLTPFVALSALVALLVLRFAIAHMKSTSFFGMDVTKESSATLWMLGIGLTSFFTAPIFLSALWCAIASWRRGLKTPETKTVLPGLTILRNTQFFVWGSALFYAFAYSIIAAVMVWQGVPSWHLPLPVLGSIEFSNVGFNLLFVWFFFVVFSLVNWFFYARIFAAPPRTHSLYALRRFRQTLLALVPIYSALWVLVALFSIPQRRLAETQLDDLIAHGELYVAQHPGKYR